MNTKELNLQEMQSVNGGILGGLLGGSDNSMLNITNGLQLSFEKTDEDGESTKFSFTDVFGLNFLSND
ncbi:MAG: hypothetical protein J7527_08035 [Chitinophagaceae bacterium]|nr:hypothetical protein [Chitinophagaceae bacterium]